MKKLVGLVSVFFLLVNVNFSQEINTIKISSEIKKVTVFLTGGEELRTATVNLKKGRNKL